jgi:3-oxoacyl-[acyl-carrier protein] reductase
MDLGLKDKVAVITGAGSQIGFGKAIALTLAREGCDVIVSDINLEGAEQTAAEVRALGRKAIAIKADVRKIDEVNDMVKAALEQYGKIDILVNNAGAPAVGPPMSEEVWDINVNTNFKGTWYCTNAVLPQMRERKSGKIINFSSSVARSGSGGLYAAAKSAIIGLTKTLARQEGPSGINVNGIAPGMADTGLQVIIKTTPEQKEAFRSSVPMRRLTTTQDIANVVAFLASDVSSDITGQTIQVDGGEYMW